MKSKLLFPVILITSIFLIGFSVFKLYNQTLLIYPPNQQPATYSCPVHTEIVQNKRGNCPKCGLVLYKNKQGKVAKITLNE
jgi:uncharacterized paraquat-inducible protein A